MNQNAALSARHRRLLRPVAALMLGALASVAVADDFFAVFGLPDHDQRRKNLPGDGSMYCVPTSTWNLIDFMALHGIPALRKHPLDPNNNLLNSNPYSGHTFRISSMGAFMNTDPANGTNGSGWTNGLIDYVEYVSNVPLLLFSYNKTAQFPSPRTMLQWMRLGGLVSFCYGRYSNPYGEDKKRNGGHCVTLAQVKETEVALPNPAEIPWLPTSYNKYQIGYRDPASDEGSGDPDRLTKQSPFATTIRDLTSEKANFDGTNTVLYGIGPKPDDPTKNYAYIDGYRVILPMILLTNVINSDNFKLKFSLNYAAEKNMWDPKLLGELNIPFKRALDIAIDPIVTSFVRIEAGNRNIYQSDYLGRGNRLMARAERIPLAVEYGGPDLGLFVLMADRISKLGRDNMWIDTKGLGFRGEAMAYDPINRKIVVAGEGKLRMFDEDLTPREIMNVPELRGEGALVMRFDPTGNGLYAMRQGNPLMRRFGLTNGAYRLKAQFSVGEGTSPDSFDFGPGGLYVGVNGQLMQFKPNGVATRTTLFAGSPCGNIVRFGRHFSNHDPAAYPLPAWRDLEEPGE